MAGRLIDADALKSALARAAMYYSYRNGPMRTIDFESLIDKQPSVDAVPVVWLNNKFMDIQNKDKALSRAAWLVLHAWQKEQEAR